MMNDLSQKSNPGPSADRSRSQDRVHADHAVRHGLVRIGIQFSILVAVSLIIARLDLDRSIAANFYHPEKRWFMGNDPLWKWLYQYGTIPGVLLALACLIGWWTTFYRQTLHAYRPMLLLVVLTTVIAAGILVNGILKPYWGRPRPNQTTDFGGYYTYRHVYSPGTPGKGASFPCGHCTMGFTFIALYAFKRKSRSLAYAGAGFGIVLGGLLSVARIVNGAHFLSDAMWSLGIVSMTATALYYCVLKIPVQRDPALTAGLARGRRIALTTAVVIAAAVIVMAFMTRRPFFKTMEYYPALPHGIESIEIAMNHTPEKIETHHRPNARPAVLIHAHGFGWAYVDYEVESHQRVRGNTMVLQCVINARSYFSELDHSVEIILPEARAAVQVSVTSLNESGMNPPEENH